MKRFYLTISVIFILFEVSSQSLSHNYILTKTMLYNTATKALDKIDYFDGLGRPVESVLKGASPTKKDIVTLQEYDGVGRESNSWLPVPTGGMGAYVAPAGLKSASNTFYGDAAAYSNPVYESSPLNRIEQHYGPGALWRSGGASVKSGYLTNTPGGVLSCGLYVVGGATSLKRTGVYAANELYVTQTTDEDKNVSYVFTDKLGQTVISKFTMYKKWQC